MQDVVDIHAHVVPPRLVQRLASGRAPGGVTARRIDAGWVVTVPGSGDTRPAGVGLTEPARGQQYRARTGVSRQVLSPWMDIQAGAMPAAEARAWAGWVNEAMLELAGDLGVAILGTIDTSDPQRGAADLEQLIRHPAIAGILLSTNPENGPPLHHPSFDPVWTVAERLAVPVVLHPPTCGPTQALSTLDGLGNVHGRLIDSTVAASELILHGLLDRHPALRLVLVHGGGFLPYQARRLDGGYRTGESRRRSLQRELPSAYLADLYYDTVALSAPAIAFLAGLVGTGHVLLGTDYPFPLGDPDPVATVRAAGPPAADTARILGGNALELFGKPA